MLNLGTITSIYFFGVEERNLSSLGRKIINNLSLTLNKKKIWSIFSYVFWGMMSTFVNVITFTIATHIEFSWIIANLFSWILSILFAFVTNKIFVFHSHTTSFPALLWEFNKFLIARVLSLVLDYSLMGFLIGVVLCKDILAKIITQIVVVSVNYVFSRIFIFKKPI